MSTGNALVTGAGGFIGYNLANHLVEQGWNVRGIDLHYPENPGTGREVRFQAVRGDFRDNTLIRRLLRDTDVLFHLASAHLQIKLDTSEYWNVNVRSLPGLLETAKESGVSRVVHVSSVGIYGSLEARPANEETPCRPQSVYGQTKLEGEKVVVQFARRHAFPIVILRPGWVYGPGCPRTVKLYRALRKRRFPMIGPCGNLRQPLFIKDFLQACLLASANDSLSGESFLVAGAQAITSRELITSFCETLDLPKPWLHLPYFAGRVIALGCETAFLCVRKEPPMSRRSLEFFDCNNSFDITKAKQQLRFEPEYGFQNGLAETKTWLENEAA